MTNVVPGLGLVHVGARPVNRSYLGHLICICQTVNRLYHCMTTFYDDDVARKTRIRILDEAVYRDSLSFFSLLSVPVG